MSPPRDPGLQAERTALAWNRTAVALAAVALLVVRAGLQLDALPTFGAGLLLLLLSGGLALTGMVRRRQLDAGRAVLPSPWLIRAAALVTLLAVLVAVPTVLLPQR